MGNIYRQIALIIAEIMDCPVSEVQNLSVMDRGMTNRSYSFTFKNKNYLARVPGEGTGQLIDREKEYYVYKQVSPLNICDDVVYISPKTGYKVTVCWDDARICDPLSQNDVAACMAKLREFHNLALTVPYSFDIFERIKFYESLWDKPSQYEDYFDTLANVMTLQDYISKCPISPVLSHIDAVPDNFLFIPNGDNTEIRLIDWEYAAMQDPHVDIAMFAIYSMYERPLVESLIDAYFPEGCPNGVRTKIYAYIAMCGLLWSNWCEYKKQLGVEFGEYALSQYMFAKNYYQIFMESQE